MNANFGAITLTKTFYARNKERNVANFIKIQNKEFVKI